jgi:uncharacterized protein (TIGR03437 family)
VLFRSVAASTQDGIPWLIPTSTRCSPPCGSVGVDMTAEGLPPGTYHGEIDLTGPAGSPKPATIPVTFYVTDGVPPLPQPGPPLGVSILNAASQRSGSISPGEMLTIFGLNIGPSPAAGLSLDSDGKVSTTAGGARVLFDDIPAPMLYASPTQVNTIVPFEVNGRPAVNVKMVFNGASAVAIGVPVVASAPGIFTNDGSGQGQATTSNQDGSANSAANPADRGSMIAILATGAGQMTPAVVTGAIAPGTGSKPVLPASCTIGGIDAAIHAAASAPDLVEGVFQVHVLVPEGVAPGPSVPIALRVGATPSPSGVTIAVK